MRSYVNIYIRPHGTTGSSFFHVVVTKAVVQMPIVPTLMV